MTPSRLTGIWMASATESWTRPSRFLAAATLCVVCGSAFAAPQRLVVLRHAEKGDDWHLSPTGVRRAHALATQYLGRGATPSLFARGDAPAAFFAITIHTVETVVPAATTWAQPTVTWAVLPSDDPAAHDLDLNRRTRDAARDLMRNPRWHGQTVVVCWEHHRIADAALEARFPRERVTLRQLLRLDRLPQPARSRVPTTWHGDDYAAMWIIAFDARGRPRHFETRQQRFAPPYDDLP
jgi:hypothetical protein